MLTVKLSVRHAVAVTLAFSLVACSETAVAPTAKFDTSELKGPTIGEANRVMVLGTAHLRNMPDGFEAEHLGPLIDRLATWGPDRIAVENQPGPLCHYMRSFPSRHAGAVEFYCYDPTRAGEIVGLSVPEAIAKLDQAISDGIEDPSPGERRRMVALSLAAGEKASAMLHWLALPEAERVADELLNAELISILETQIDRGGEVALIAAPLAARLGHAGITAMDNQATHFNSPSSLDREARGKAIEAAWDNEACAERLPMEEAADAAATTPEGVDAMYQLMNAPEHAARIFNCDFGAAMNEPSNEAYGRRYLAYWETRNLRMAANIREAMGEDPGSKTLVIVGASHKFYLEHYLDQMHDVEVISTDRVLPDAE